MEHRPLPSSRRRVLDLLVNATTPLSVAQLCESTGLHSNTVRAQLSLLIDMGRAERVPEQRSRPGRPRLLYRAVRQVAPSDPYRALAAELAAGIASATEGQSAGMAAGQRLARNQLQKHGEPATPVTPDESIAMAVEGLEVLGFETATEPLGDRLYLSHCPFADMAREDPAICQLHDELLRGFLDELGSGVSLRRLDVFVKPDLCVAHLNRPDVPAA